MRIDVYELEKEEVGEIIKKYRMNVNDLIHI